MTDYTITRLVIPESLEDAGAADFIASCGLVNRVTESILGSRDFALEPAERLPFAKQTDWSRAYFIAKAEGQVVGLSGYEAQRSDDAKECWIELHVDEAHRRAGIGSALLDRIIETAQTEAKTQIFARVFTRNDLPGPRMDAGSGFGSVAADDTGPSFSLVRDFTLEQVGQINRLALPVERAVFDERVAAARAGYGDEYELLRWSGRTPEEHLAGMAALSTAMSTADPHGDLDVTEDVWDADRLRESEERESASPRTRLTAVARHVASGELVAFTTLDVPPEAARPVNQWATLVADGHRGKRLGLAIKLENLRQLMDDFPGHPSVTTINAEENEFMIAVNRSVGFATVGRGGIFRRMLEPAN
jgi:GNAT superfamily N-acetyltransferase